MWDIKMILLLVFTLQLLSVNRIPLIRYNYA